MQIPVRSRRQFLKALGFGAVSLAVPGCQTILGRSSHDRRSTREPNIVFILADDMGYGDLACQNPDSKVPTPNLDKLAREGIRFTDAHSPSAVCT
ncbi:MAG: sulfatase-like hydrolase/transferase, partial [Planctomycetota bacterium]